MSSAYLSFFPPKFKLTFLPFTTFYVISRISKNKKAIPKPFFVSETAFAAYFCLYRELFFRFFDFIAHVFIYNSSLFRRAFDFVSGFYASFEHFFAERVFDFSDNRASERSCSVYGVKCLLLRGMISPCRRRLSQCRGIRSSSLPRRALFPLFHVYSRRLIY